MNEKNKTELWNIISMKEFMILIVIKTNEKKKTVENC